jgi:hypothetical protein
MKRGHHTESTLNDERSQSNDSSIYNDYNSDHSEFGETRNTNKLFEKLPEIKSKIAQFLKLEVLK